MPRETEIPKIVPIVEPISATWPTAPWMRRPKIGASAERIDSGRW